MKKLLSIVEQGGYPDFTELYREAGYEVEQTTSIREATRWLKKNVADLIVTEFNYDPYFRDRLSNVETIASIAERHPETRLVVLVEKEEADMLKRLEDQYEFAGTLIFPIDEAALKALL
ncbi:MAG: hypothetical protein DSZ33_00575 [Gammaproteobacteria bacterium]|nr:MAG: hypothetical protein DSZ33_00575 [Gammaproteobacteria bacterium]